MKHMGSKLMSVGFLITGFIFAGTAAAAAMPSITAEHASNAPWRAGIIQSAGKIIHPVPKDAVYMPNPAATYKVIFALTDGGSNRAKLNPALMHVARTVDLYVAAGVPLDHLKFVAIAYGAATGLVLDNAAYKKEFGFNNPNLAVIRDLKAHGINVVVCGQAMMEHHYRFAWSATPVALSGLTTVTMLENQGYGLMQE